MTSNPEPTRHAAPAPRRPPLPVGPGGRLPPVQALLGAVLFFGAQAMGAIGLGIYIVTTMLERLTADGKTLDQGTISAIMLTDGPASAVYFGSYAALSLIGFALLLWGFARTDFRLTFAPRGIAAELGAGVLLGGGLIAAGGLILLALGVYRGHDFGVGPGVLVGVMLGVGAACGEEVFFRGFLLRLLNARFGSTVAVAVLSVGFGLVHVTNGGAGWYGALAIVLSAGLLLNASYLLTGRLWLPIGIHFAWNAMQAAVFGTDVSGSGSGRGLWAGELTGPTWLSGGTMGLEGSVVVIVIGLAAGIGLTVLAVKRGRWRSFATARAEVARAKADRAAAKAALATASGAGPVLGPV